jgi:RimJ/RimL family protein N-acetyltransferase
MTYWSAPPHQSITETEADIAWWLEANGDAAFAIEDGEGALAGRVGLYRVREGVREVGIILRPDQAGQGHGLRRGAGAVRAYRVFSPRAASDRRRHLIPSNLASCRLFEACDFRLEARLKHNWRTHLGLRDSLIYALFPEDR